jgi:hypothetical protein
MLDSAEKPALAGLTMEGSRLRLPEASQTPPGSKFFDGERFFSAIICIDATPVDPPHLKWERDGKRKVRSRFCCLSTEQTDTAGGREFYQSEIPPNRFLIRTEFFGSLCRQHQKKLPLMYLLR